ncbi:hypothetical protein NXS19_010687 [Fusarium pseudograminearum]|nr:hypothetical protein NXS19_010687 [Fusarium pseudograminearum]
MRQSFLTGLLAAPCLPTQSPSLATSTSLSALVPAVAGDDYATTNYTVPAYSANASEDPEISWNFFVKHYADDERQARDFKTTYDTPDGEYTGLNPPLMPSSRVLCTLVLRLSVAALLTTL